MLGPACALLSLALLAGCGDDEPASPDPTSPSSSSGTPAGPTAPETGPAEAGDGPCSQVTDAALTEATGTAQEVLSPVSEGAFVECRTAFDARGMTVQWDIVEATSPFSDIGEQEQLPGLGLREVRIGGQPAWLLQGTVVDTESVRIVMLLDDRKLSVDANDAADPSATVARPQLRAAAEAVAEAYVAVSG